MALQQGHAMAPLLRAKGGFHTVPPRRIFIASARHRV